MKLRPQRIAIAVDGASLVAPTDRVAIAAVSGGVALWDTDNRRGALGYVYLPQTAGLSLLTNDAQSGRVYGVAPDSGDALWSIAQAEGYLTMAPQTLRLGATAHLRSAPVVVGRSEKQLAVGGANQLYLVPITKDGAVPGNAATSVQSLAVNAPSLQALAYSHKHDRLYVAVETLLEKVAENKR
jgi:hypothetical protein